MLIKHPIIEDKGLSYSSLEGPENSVFVRGIIRNTDTIKLPLEWEHIVNPHSITVSITPIGAHQNIMIKRASCREVVIQTLSSIPISCYYHVFGERNDIKKLEIIVDYLPEEL